MDTTPISLSSSKNLELKLAPRHILLHELEVSDVYLSESISDQAISLQDQQITESITKQLQFLRTKIAHDLLTRYVEDYEIGIINQENDCEKAAEVVEVLWVTRSPYALLKDLGSSLTREQRIAINITVGGKTLPYLHKIKSQRLRASGVRDDLETEINLLHELQMLFSNSQVMYGQSAQQKSPNSKVEVPRQHEIIVPRININLCKPSASANELGRNYTAVIYEYATGEYLALPAREVQKEFNPQHLLRVLGCICAGGTLDFIATSELIAPLLALNYQAYLQRQNPLVATYYRNYREYVVALLGANSRDAKLFAKLGEEATCQEQTSSTISSQDNVLLLPEAEGMSLNKVTYTQAQAHLLENITAREFGEENITTQPQTRNYQLHLEVVLGERGTGKTTLVQQVAREWLAQFGVMRRCIFATHLVSAYSRQADLDGIEFIVYDELLERVAQVQEQACSESIQRTSADSDAYLWIIDEAAKVPVAILESFLNRVRGKVILATTVSSYENSGVGLVHKLLGRKMLEQLAQAAQTQCLRLWVLHTNYRYPRDYLSWCQQQLAGTCELTELLEANLDYYLQRVPQARSSIEMWQVQHVNTTLQPTKLLVSSQSTVNTPRSSSIPTTQLQVRQCRSVHEIREFLRLCYICHYQTTPQDFALALATEQVQLFGMYKGTQLIGGCTLITEQAQVQERKLVLSGSSGNLALKLLHTQVAEFVAEPQVEKKQPEVRLQRIARLFLAPHYRKSRVTMANCQYELQFFQAGEMQFEQEREGSQQLEGESVKLSHFLVEQLIKQGYLDLQQLVVLVGYEPALEKFWRELGCKLIYRTQEVNSASGQSTAVFIPKHSQHPVLSFYAKLLGACDA